MRTCIESKCSSGFVHAQQGICLPKFAEACNERTLFSCVQLGKQVRLCVQLKALSCQANFGGQAMHLSWEELAIKAM